MIIYYLLALLLIGIDQLSKWYIVQNFELYGEQNLIPGFLSLFYIQNRGAAWGIFEGRMIFFFIITVVVVGYMIYSFHKYNTDSKIIGWSFSLILAGALGNFIDRVFNGFVVDMFRFDFFNFPIFNIADACLTIGVILMIIYILFVEGKDDKENTHSKQ